MRRPLALALALALPLVAPHAMADQYQDSTLGVNLGFIAPGVWDLFRFQVPAGPVEARLTWVEPTVFPFADYDLRLYRPWAYDDGDFDDHELIAQSSQHPYAHHAEGIRSFLDAGTYWLVVVPFQAQGERYTLDTNVGSLDNAGTHLGYVAYEE